VAEMAEQIDSMVPQIRFKGFVGEWEEKTLGELTPLRGGFAFQSGQYREAGIPIVKISNVLATGDVGGVFAFYDEQANDNNYSLPNNAALLAMSGATTGKVSILKKSFSKKVYQNQRVGYFEDLEIVDYPFISTLVRSIFFTQQLDSVLVAGAQPNVSSKDINSFEFRIPKSRVEQTKIGTYFKALDRMIELHQRKHDKLVTLKQAMLQKMFPQDGATTPEIRFKGFEGDWEEKILGNITDSYSGGTPSVGNHSYYGGEIHFIRSAEINSKSTELALTKVGLQSSSAKLVRKGDILYALYGATSGEVGVSQINGAINQAILCIKPHMGCSSQFLAIWLRNKKMTIIGTYLQGGQGNLSGNIIKSLNVDIPCIVEQQKIGTYFRKLDTLITQHATQLEKLKQIKSACLAKMFV